MKKNLFMTNHAFARRVTSFFMLIVFSLTTILLPAQASAQSIGIPGVNLPAVGTMLGLSESFQPAIIRGMTVYPDNPLKFDFIVNTGDKNLKGQALEKESQKLIKYFLASLTTPENEFWVNLSPYESGRIIPEALGTTEMGRDMLAQDYILKQLTASLLYPEKDLGNKFWQRVHEKAKKLYGVSEVPVDTFNKVWIMPDKAAVYENDNRVFVVERHLKVMLAEDYEKNLTPPSPLFKKAGEIGSTQLTPSLDKEGEGGVLKNNIPSQIMRELIIPEIEKEVNEGENFAVVRQIYNSMILATWYKKRLKESLLGQVYVNQNKVKGIDLADKATKQKIYEQYLAAFKKGVYNYIKEDVDALTNEPIPTKYFSGGLTAGAVTQAALTEYNGELSRQPKVVSAAVTQPLTDKGEDVVVSSTLVENANQAQAAAATPIKSVLTDLRTNASFAIPKSSFMDTKLYQLTGAASTWSVSMGGIMERIQGFGLGAETWAIEAAEFATYHPGTVLLGAIAFYAVASFDPIGYFRNKVDFNLRQANALKDDDQKRYLYLDRIVARGQEVVPDLLNQFQQPDASQAKVRDIAYVLGKLKVAQAVEPLISKFSQNIAVDEIVVALGEIGGQKASELLAQQLLEKGSLRSIAVAEGLVKLGVDRGKEFLFEMLKSTDIKLRTAARVSLSRLEINDAPAVIIYDEVYQRLQAVVSPENITLQYNFASEFSAAYAIALSGGDFYVTYVSEATVLRPVKENSSLNADYEKVIVPAKLVIVKEGNKSSPSSASSGIDKLQLTGAVGDLTVSAQGVSELAKDSLTERTSDSSSSAITRWLDNSYLWNVRQLLPRFPTEKRLKALGNLVRLNDSRAIESIRPLLGDDNSQIKARAAYALGHFNDQNVKGQLLSLLSDPWTEVRKAARGALTRFGTETNELIDANIKALSASKEARLEAANELAQLGRGRDDVYNALLSLLESIDSDDRLVGANALGWLQDSRAGQRLLALLDKEFESSKVIEQVIHSLGRLKEYQAQEPLIKMLFSYSELEISAYRALRQIGGPKANFIISVVEKIKSQNPDLLDSEILGVLLPKVFLMSIEGYDFVATYTPQEGHMSTQVQEGFYSDAQGYVPFRHVFGPYFIQTKEGIPVNVVRGKKTSNPIAIFSAEFIDSLRSSLQPHLEDDQLGVSLRLGEPQEEIQSSSSAAIDIEKIITDIKSGDQLAVETLISLLANESRSYRQRVRAVLKDLNINDLRIDLYDSVEQRLRATVPADVDFDVFGQKVLEAYRIVLAGDDFSAEYVQRMLTEYDWSGIYDTYSWPEDPNNREYQTLDPDSLTITRIPKTTDSGVASAAVTQPVGGIDFNSAALDLQIKRDGNGVALPLPQQTIQNMKIDGFYPVIINIAPVNIPMLLGQKTQKEPIQLSALR